MLFFEIPSQEDFSLLTNSHYFPARTVPDIITVLFFKIILMLKVTVLT
jgi:hypothetical protein